MPNLLRRLLSAHDLERRGADLAVLIALAALLELAYRILVLWLPMPVSLAFLPTLRTMLEHRIARAEEAAEGKPRPGRGKVAQRRTA